MPALVAAVLGVTLATATTICTVATVVIMAATIAYSAYAMATAPDMPGYSAEVRGRTQVVRSAVTPRRIIYGQCMVSGPLAYALSYGKDNKYLYMVILLANHEVEEIGDIYLGDKLSTDAHFLKTDVTKTYKIGTDGKLTVTDDDWIGDKTHWPGYIILPNNSYALVTPHINNGTYDFGIQNAGASIALTYSRTYVKITKHYGAANQAADEDLIKNSDGQWTVNHTLSGIAYLTVRLEFDNTVFATGIPNIKAVVKGKKDIYDPRTKSYQYTDNWALCILDYLCADFGLNCSLNEINLPAAIEAANLCEEAVYVQTGTGVGYSIDNAGYEQGRRLLKLINGTGTILNGDQITITAPAGTWNKVDYIASTHTYDIDASGGLRDGYIYLADPGLIDALPPTNCSVTVVKYNIEKRYTCNGTFSVDQKPVEIMKKLLTGAAGTVVWSQGCYIIQPAKWAPPVMALTESDLRDKISIQTGTSIRDKCNTVRGTYVSPANSWQQTDFPMQQSSIALNNDAGEELCQNIELPYTISCPMAQRIARIHLYKSLYGQTINFPAKMTPFVLQPGDNIWLNLPLLGFNRAIFKVMSWTLGADGGVDLVLSQDDEAIYEWTSDMETVVPPASNTKLPNPWVVSPPQNIVVTEALYATNVESQIKVRVDLSWDEITTTRHYEVETNFGDGFKSAGQVSSEQFTIYDVPTGTCQFRVRAVNSFGATSTWTTITYKVIGKDAPPSDVAGFKVVANKGLIEFSWNTNTDLDIDYYEIRLGISWESGDIIVTNLTSSTYTWQPDSFSNKQFWIKAVDTSGNYSVNAITAILVVTPPIVENVSQQVIDNNVLLSWDETEGSYSIDYCEIRKGMDYNTADIIGKIKGTFTALFETQSSTYKYWITAVDVTGLRSTPAGVYATVNQPPDYVLNDQRSLIWNGQQISSCVDNKIFYAPVNLTETWQQHFTSRGWTTIQNQISAGYLYYLQPTPNTGKYVEFIDYGTIIPNTKISLALTKTTLAGTVNITPTISASADNATWVDYPNTYEVYATNFRYVKITLDFSTDGNGLLAITDSNIRLDVKLKTTQGATMVNAGDASGTLVDISGQFLDVQAINLTPQATIPAIAIYDFLDVPNPQNFKIYLYNMSGQRINGNVSWTVRGV